MCAYVYALMWRLCLRVSHVYDIYIRVYYSNHFCVCSVSVCVHVCPCAITPPGSTFLHIHRPVYRQLYPDKRVKEEHRNTNKRNEKRPEEQPVNDGGQPVPIGRVVRLRLHRRRRPSPSLTMPLPDNVPALPQPPDRPDGAVRRAVLLTRPLEAGVAGAVDASGRQEMLVGGRWTVRPDHRGARTSPIVRRCRRWTTFGAGGFVLALAEESREVVEKDEMSPTRHRPVGQLVQVQHQHRQHHR